MRTTFLVGRLTPKSAEIIVVNESGAPPFPGPFLLKALVRPRPPTSSLNAKVRELPH
jgi:hypothetical protein